MQGDMYAEAERGVMRCHVTHACCDFLQQATAVQQVVGRGVCICIAASIAVKRFGPQPKHSKSWVCIVGECDTVYWSMPKMSIDWTVIVVTVT